MTWRDRARPIIQKVIQKNHGKPEKEIRQALQEAYPFGEKTNHPYKIWLDEIRKQMPANLNILPIFNKEREE